MENLKELFKTHPSVSVFHMTSDGQFFIQQHHADAHAQTLEDKEVVPCKRDDDETETVVDNRTREELLATYLVLFGKKAANNIGNEKLLKAVQEKEAEAKGNPEMQDHVVTQEDLDGNPELVEQGVSVGDTIQLPKA